MSGWTRMNLSKGIIRALDELDYSVPTEIQKATIPKGLNSKTNILAAAETGSGKTFAYGLPLVQKVNAHVEKWGDRPEKVEQKVHGPDDGDAENFIDDPKQIFGGTKIVEGPLGLVLCPTRELAVQVHDQLQNITKYTKVRTAVIIGGLSNEKQGNYE